MDGLHKRMAIAKANLMVWKITSGHNCGMQNKNDKMMRRGDQMLRDTKDRLRGPTFL